MQQHDALSVHRFFLRCAQSGALLFAWIFIFEYFSVVGTLGQAAAYTALTFCLAHVVSFALTPFSARATRNGIASLTSKALFALLCSYLLLGALLSGFVTPAVWGIIGFAILFGVYRSFYWISYQAYMALGVKNNTYEVVVALMPLLFGYIATLSPHPATIFIIAALLVGISVVPHMRIQNTIERFPWGVGETFREFFKAHHRTVAVRSMLDGAHATALFLLWPLAIFMMLEWSYALVGIVFSLTLLTILFVRYIQRRFWSQSLVWHTPSIRALHILSAWIFRLVAATPLSIVAVGVYAHIYGNEREEADIFAFEHIADRGVYLDEHTVLKEMGASLGKIIIALVFASVASFTSISVALAVVFVLVAITSGAILLVVRRSVMY